MPLSPEEQALQPKLYIITHSDLPTGYQVPQVTHAAMEFASAHPDKQREWYRTSNSVIVLNAKNELDLIEFTLKLKEKGIEFTEFREPDIGNELTAIAISPGPKVKKACSGLPLAGKRVNEGAQERLQRKFDVVEAMIQCEQRAGQTWDCIPGCSATLCKAQSQNMVQHGESVRDYLFDLVSFLRNPHYTPRFQWRFPRWLLSHAKSLVDKLPPDHILEKYTLWHDCGKPSCKTTDSDGRPHYPDHARESARIFRELYPEQAEVAKLIEQDMDIHNLSSEGIQGFSERPGAIALLLTGLASTHSNAALFGGIGSDSFKIKWKNLNKCGERICLALFK